ncbi:hypothetical protein BGT96224_A21068, partial [Blumeria graminis f. sp. tritici 96224]
MNRTPPKVRESAVGLPILSQLHLKERTLESKKNTDSTSNDHRDPSLDNIQQEIPKRNITHRDKSRKYRPKSRYLTRPSSNEGKNEVPGQGEQKDNAHVTTQLMKLKATRTKSIIDPAEHHYQKRPTEVTPRYLKLEGFRDSQSIIDHVFAQTLGEEMVHLTQRIKSDHPQVFVHENEIFEWLETFFKDPNERETARIQHSRCRMSPNKTFSTFYGRFSALANKARISQADQLQDMFRKFRPDLHQQAIDFMATEPDYSSALKRFYFYDNELRINRESRNRRRTSNSTVLKAPGISELTNTNNRKFYNCGKTGLVSRDCTKPKKVAAIASPIRQIEEENVVGAEATPVILD